MVNWSNILRKGGWLNNSEGEPLVAVAENVCAMCMRSEEVVGELVMHQVAYPFHCSQKKICSECKDRLCRAILKALELVGWE
jgi:hypothetical protein